MPSSPPRVSIGMPVYNGERYLQQALDSILSQTFADFELIISDNASTDATQEICSAYAVKDRRIRYHRSERNVGAGPNHNRTIELANGEYFKWAHYDDVWGPELLARCVEVLDRYPTVVLCYAATKIIDENGAFVRDLKDGLDLRAVSPVDRYRAFHKRYRRQTATGHIFLGLMRLETLKRTRQHDSIFSADIVLLAELALLGEFHEITEPLFFRRVHPGSSMTKYTPQGVVVWADPTYRGQIRLPHWRLAFELARSLQSSHLSVYDKVRCSPQIALWYKRFRAALARELWLAVKQIMRLAPVESGDAV